MLLQIRKDFLGNLNTNSRSIRIPDNSPLLLTQALPTSSTCLELLRSSKSMQALIIDTACFGQRCMMTPFIASTVEDCYTTDRNLADVIWE